MTELIIGMDGFIGRNLCRHLPGALRTTRRNCHEAGVHYFDLTKRGPLPEADIVYICAGVNGNLTCAQRPHESFKTNVDGTIYIAEYYQNRAFVVWVSSTTVQWLRELYGVQKLAAESHLRTLAHVGIVRAGRVLQSNVDDLCETMIRIGRGKERGIVFWNEDEQPYEH